MPATIDENTEFDYKVPLSPMDGNLVAINTETGMANIIFYQVRKATGDHIDKVDVTAAAILSVNDLTKFRDAITENLELPHRRSEP